MSAGLPAILTKSLRNFFVDLYWQTPGHLFQTDRDWFYRNPYRFPICDHPSISFDVIQPMQLRQHYWRTYEITLEFG